MDENIDVLQNLFIGGSLLHMYMHNCTFPRNCWSKLKKKFAGCNGLSYKHNKGFSHFHPIPGKIESHWTCQSCQFPFSQQL